LSKIINVHASDDHKLLIDFEDGSNIMYNMQKLVETIPYYRLKDLSNFYSVKFDDKSVYWDNGNENPKYFPIRLSVDTILFSLRG